MLEIICNDDADDFNDDDEDDWQGSSDNIRANLNYIKLPENQCILPTSL